MFDTRFNNGYQNTVMPLNTNTDPYADPYLNQMPQNTYGQNPYTQGNVLSNMMSNNAPYPTPPSQSFPAANMQNPNTVSYADGGTVKKKKNKVENSPYPMLAEMIRKQGKGEDTVLAHINPLEAMILKDLGGSGAINPKTGLPQFELFNPRKVFERLKREGKLNFIPVANTRLPSAGENPNIVGGIPNLGETLRNKGAMSDTKQPNAGGFWSSPIKHAKQMMREPSAEQPNIVPGLPGNLTETLNSARSMPYNFNFGSFWSKSNRSKRLKQALENPSDVNEEEPTPQEQRGVFHNLHPNATYAAGGIVGKSNRENNPYPSMAEMIRRQGHDEDTILAHINPLEAMLLKDMGGSGTINKKTGLPQFSFWSNPGKATKSFLTKPKRAIAEIVGIGSALFGGPLGGAVGGAAKEAILGRPKNMLRGAISGGLQGWALPGAANLAGQGLSRLGANSVGNALQSYGTSNMGSWLGNMGQMGQGASGLTSSLGNMFGGGNMSGGERLLAPGENNMSSYMGGSSSPQSALASSITNPQGEMGFTDKLLGNTKDFLTKPKNLLTLGSLAGSFMNRPKEKKEKTPEQQADEAKRLERALRLSPADRAGMEANLLAEEQMRRRIARQKFLPEERLGNIEPMYRKSNTPEEYKKHGKWLNYYNNPQFTGEPIPYKKGGSILPNMMYEAEEMEYPSGLGRYIAGDTNGQDDKIQALLSDGEYVIPADVVAHLGDGNNTAGAKKLDMGLKKIRKHKGGIINKLPPKAKSLASYLK